MVQILHGLDSTGAWSSPRKKAQTQMRCDRLIAACCRCFGKQDRLCLSDEKCSGGRQTGLGDSEGRDSARLRRREVPDENETAKCLTVCCDLLQIDFCKLALFFREMEG